MSIKKIKKLIESINNEVILYRGSEFDDEFGVGNYFSTDYNFSKNYGVVKKYKASLGRVFNIINPEHFKMLKDEVGEITDPYADEDNYPELIDIQEPSVISATGNTWEVTEQFLDFIPDLDSEGFDSVEIWEDGIVNYIIFHPEERVVRIENEDYVASVKPTYMKSYGTDVDIYLNSDFIELSKLLKKYGALRFLLNNKMDYVVWDAEGTYHDIVPKKVEEFSFNDVRGIIYLKESLLYVYARSLENSIFYNNDEDFPENHKEEIIEKLEQTKFFKNLNKAGIYRITIGKSL